MATTEQFYTGDGTTTLFTFPFEYITKDDVKVSLDDVVTTAYTYANATTIEMTTAPALGVQLRIYRLTDVDDLKATFAAGSSIRAVDLNDNFQQNNFAVEELRNYSWDNEIDTIHSDETWDSTDTKIATNAALDARFIDVEGDLIASTETWVSDDAHVATTAALDARFQDELSETITSSETWPDNDDTIATTAAIDDRIDTAITNDIGTDGTGITVTDDGDGTITLGLAAGSIDFDRIKAEDIETSADYDAAWDNDNQIATVNAIATRLDALVQTATPSGSDWKVGKLWLQNDADRTFSMWDGSTWLGIASGGTFTTQPTVIYVDSVNGNDANDGHRIINPMRTIRAAVASADAGDIILVAPGVYQETLPIDIEVDNLSIVGSSQRSCFIHPTVATEENTMFRVNSGSYIDGFTFVGLKASGTRGGHPVDNDPVEGLPTNQAWVAEFFPNATIRKSPYINNCTNYADSGINNAAFDPNNYAGTGGDISSNPTGGGVFVDGDAVAQASPLRSMVINEFTQVCLDGPGLLVANNGYCQAVSFFSTFCHYHAKALNGGQINMEVGTTDFGRFGLIADGKSSTAIFTSTVNAAAVIGDTIISIDAPTAAADWFGTAERPGNTMLCQVGTDIYPILSSTADGAGWDVTISNPRTTNREINDGLVADIANGATISFFLRSQISSAAHTFEYAGSGTNYTALPYNGGAPDQAAEIIETGAAAIVGNQTEGRVWYSSTDQNGNFKVGDTFQVNQQTGFVTIDPTSVAINVVADLTPQLGGNLDVQTFEINTSTSNGDVTVSSNGNGDINLTAPGSGLIQVTEANLTQVPIVTQHDIGTAANEVPLNQMLGGMAFQDPASVVIDGGTASVDGGNFGGLTVDSAAADNSVTLDSSGRLLVGTSSSDTSRLSTSTYNPQFQVKGAWTNGTASITCTNDYPVLWLNGTAAAVVNAGVAKISFNAFDGANYTQAATIDAQIDGTPGTNDMPGRLMFSTTADGAFSPTERLRITSDGTLQLRNSPGIDFSQIQTNAAGMTSETLDSYEEGTWTPSLGGTAVYNIQTGTYTKIGNTVIAYCAIRPSTLGTGSTINISGLPFTAGGSSYGGVSIGFYDGAANSLVDILGHVSPSGPKIVITCKTAASNNSGANDFFGNNARIYLTAVYRI